MPTYRIDRSSRPVGADVTQHWIPLRTGYWKTLKMALNTAEDMSDMIGYATRVVPIEPEEFNAQVAQED